jgi:anti-anti-sigma factor
VIQESPRRLRLIGELDVAGASLVRTLVRTRPIDELDLADVSFVDASGLSALLAARDGARPSPLVILTPSSAVVRILDLCDEVDTFAVWP